jgi:hypothetical protein
MMPYIYGNLKPLIALRRFHQKLGIFMISNLLHLLGKYGFSFVFKTLFNNDRSAEIKHNS